MSRWVAHLLGEPALGDLQAMALDGKSSRGSLTPFNAAVYLLAAMDQRTGGVLGQMRVEAKTNEHKAASELLRGLVLAGRVVTGDAMFCQRDLSRQIIEAGEHYLWKVDDNQPSLKEAIESAFEPAFSPYGRRRQAEGFDEARTLDAHGGRIERRHLAATTMLNGYLDWPGVAQVCRVEAEVSQGAEATHEVSYAITGVPRARAVAAALLSWHRGQWGIEDRLHWVRDVTMGEDANRTQVGSGPQVLAASRNAAISHMRSLGSTNIAASLRRNAAQVGGLLKVLYRLKKCSKLR